MGRTTEFTETVNEFIKKMNEMTDDTKRGVVVLASEKMEQGTLQVIGVAGSRKEIIKAIAAFSNHKDTSDLCKEGLILGLAEKQSAEKTNANTNNNLS